MPHVSYYRQTVLDKQDANELRKKMLAAATKTFDKGDDAITRLEGEVEEMTVFERVKQFVKDEADIVNVERSPGFVRFGHHGYDNIYVLIQRRKAEGRNDWY